MPCMGDNPLPAGHVWSNSPLRQFRQWSSSGATNEGGWKYSPETMGGRGWVGGNGWKKILYEYIVQCCMGPKIQMFLFLVFFCFGKGNSWKDGYVWICFLRFYQMKLVWTQFRTGPCLWIYLCSPGKPRKKGVDHQVAGVIDHQVSPTKGHPKRKVTTKHAWPLPSWKSFCNAVWSIFFTLTSILCCFISLLCSPHNFQPSLLPRFYIFGEQA